jgi:Arc/MetJ-type ribon-helix-helix transcriptional regulator
LDIIDKLVVNNKFASRSELIRNAIREYIKKELFIVGLHPDDIKPKTPKWGFWNK